MRGLGSSGGKCAIRCIAMARWGEMPGRRQSQQECIVGSIPPGRHSVAGKGGGRQGGAKMGRGVQAAGGLRPERRARMVAEAAAESYPTQLPNLGVLHGTSGFS